MEDINSKVNTHTSSTQSVEFRLRKVEESSQDILSHLAVIHRFMATRTNDDLPPINIPIINTDRLRKSSERSDVSSKETLLMQPTRKRPIRSLTEVRPDAFFSEEDVRFVVRRVNEEEECNDILEMIGK